MNIVFCLTFENRITTRELVDFVGDKKRGLGLQMFGLVVSKRSFELKTT